MELSLAFNKLTEQIMRYTYKINDGTEIQAMSYKKMLKKLVGPIDLLLVLWRNVGITIWSDEFIMSLRTKLKKVLPSISITEQEALDAGDAQSDFLSWKIILLAVFFLLLGYGIAGINAARKVRANLSSESAWL